MTPLHLTIGAFLFVVFMFVLFVFWPLVVVIGFIYLMCKFTIPGGYSDQNGIAQPLNPPAPPPIAQTPPRSPWSP